MGSDVVDHGTVGIRRMEISSACEASVGHEHNYDHTTIIIRGRVRVLYRYVRDGQEVEGESEEFGPGETVFIRAKVRHTIKALTDKVLYYCVFSHRDFDGIVCERFSEVCSDKAYV